jgi:hypothetical protein
MNRNVGIAAGIGIAVIIGVIIFQVNETRWEQVSVEEYYEKDGRVPGIVYPDNPQFLGPLQINKDKYLLGESVFVFISGLTMTDKGSVDFFLENGKRYATINFDGEKGPSMKEYFRPMLMKGKNICDKEQLIGTWTIVFKGYEQHELNFEMLDAILPKNELYYSGCNETDQIFPAIDPTINPAFNPEKASDPYEGKPIPPSP